MANEEQLKRLGQGVPEWNLWRRENPERIDLAGANLRGADLTGAFLTRANLGRVDLAGANLGRAFLTGAFLTGANLRGANLGRVDLTGANLAGADLTEADLSRAFLTGADLTGADLSRVDLTGAHFSLTVFAENNLTSVKGLDTIRHQGPSRIDFRTVIFPRPILATFLRGAGSSESLIDALDGRNLPSQPVSVKVFISFVPSDQNLCRNLRDHLNLLARLKMIVLSHEAVLAPDTHQWERKTSTAFQEAQVVLLLVSAPFLASDQAWKEVIEPALNRHRQGSICLIPIVLRPVDWKGSPLAGLQALPTDGRSVTEWEHIDTPLREVSEGIRKVVQPLHEALTELATKQRARDLIMAKLILAKTQTAEKQGTIQKQKQAAEKAEKTYQALQAQLREAQQHCKDLEESQETLLADIALLEHTFTTLDEEVHALDTQLQSSQEIFKGMINGTGG
jgi:uncharacterized protein YjbI with pentapeptide repeats